MTKDGAKVISVEKTVSKANGKQIEIYAPKEGYSSGAYELMITEDLKGKSGTALTESVLVKFVVK